MPTVACFSCGVAGASFKTVRSDAFVWWWLGLSIAAILAVTVAAANDAGWTSARCASGRSRGSGNGRARCCGRCCGRGRVRCCGRPALPSDAVPVPSLWSWSMLRPCPWPCSCATLQLWSRSMPWPAHPIRQRCDAGAVALVVARAAIEAVGCGPFAWT